MRQIPQDSALTQERALKALIIDRDNKVRQQIEATYAQQVGILLCFKSIVILVPLDLDFNSLCQVSNRICETGYFDT